MLAIKKNEEFRKIYSTGKSFANRYLVLYVMNNGTDVNRIGISVSRKTGNSVVRHRIKRLVREISRLHEQEMKNISDNGSDSCSGCDMVVIGRRSANGASYYEIERALLHLMNQAGII